MPINYRALAERKVNASPELLKYKKIIMYDWPEGDIHWTWILSETDENIIEWAEEITDDWDYEDEE